MQLCCGLKVNLLQVVVREASGVHGAALPGDSGKMEVADASSGSSKVSCCHCGLTC